MKPQVGFSRENPHETVASYISCCIVLEVVYTSVNLDRHVYARVLNERYAHLQNHDISRSYTRSDCVRFVCSYISLSGPLSILQEPYFDHNKSIAILVFPPFFSRGFYPKNICVLCVRFWFPFFMVMLHV
jgi:hypothetical protein